MNDPQPWQIRDAGPNDLEAVAAIYAEETLTGYATFETEVRPVESWAVRLTDPYPFLVAAGAEVLGFAYAGPFRERAAYHRTVETTVYLGPGQRGRGIGTALYRALLADLGAAGFRTALALIALPNPASVRLHERAGFRSRGVLEEVGEKFGRVLDVGIYQATLGR